MIKNIYLVILAALAVACSSTTKEATSESNVATGSPKVEKVVIEAETFTESSDNFAIGGGDVSFVNMPEAGWLAFDVDINVTGRYNVTVFAQSSAEGSTVWLEDFYDNEDGRTYNITGNLFVKNSDAFLEEGVDGSPLKKGLHKMKLQSSDGNVKVDRIELTLMREHQITPVTFTQSMEGDEWSLVWSDEFDGTEIDTSKWVYDIGNWGWGNNELQYYTENRKENARVEDGNLVIEARKNDMDQEWTSARLTTRGKETFLYGKIEFRATVPREKGNWAAAWTLGDAYVDESSWPYCGEIDILESVGYEVDNETGDGIAHATVHTPAYYFKINNQISSVKDIENIAGEFHTYSVQWTPEEVRGYVDGEEYYLYDKNANELEWPFDQPQNIILNLAMGGGWGGAQGMDTTVVSQKFILDYVRVYELK